MKRSIFSTLLRVLIFIVPLEAIWNPNTGLIVNYNLKNTWYIPRTLRATNRGFEYTDNSDSLSFTYRFCPYNSDDEDNLSPYCLAGNKINTQHVLEIEDTICDAPVEPFIDWVIRSGERKQITCTEDENGFLYGYHYLLCKRLDTRTQDIKEFVTIYEFCYNPYENKLLYVSYNHFAPKILGNSLLEDEQAATFDLNMESYDMENFDSQHFSYAAQAYNNNVHYTAQLVGSPEIRGFGLARKPFFHFINTEPMDRDLSDRWEEFHKDLKRKIYHAKLKVSLFFGTLRNKNVEFTLSVPRIWWIVIYDEGMKKGTAIIMDTDVDEDYLCQSICGEANLQDIIPSFNEALFYCCPASVISRRFPLMRSVDRIYKIKKPPTIRKRIGSYLRRGSSSSSSQTHYAEYVEDDDDENSD